MQAGVAEAVEQFLQDKQQGESPTQGLEAGRSTQDFLSTM